MGNVSQFNGTSLIDKDAREQIEQLETKITFDDTDISSSFNSSDKILLKKDNTVVKGSIQDVMSTQVVDINSTNVNTSRVNAEQVTSNVVISDNIVDSQQNKYLKEQDVTSEFNINSNKPINAYASTKAFDLLSPVSKSGDYYDLKNAPTTLPASNTTSDYRSNGLEPVNGVAVFKAFESYKGKANGLATLGDDGIVPSSQLPAYVSDILEYSNKEEFPTIGENGKIYVSLNDNLTYRWSGTVYTEVSKSIAIGETSETAFRGDKGKVAYDHSSDPQILHTPNNLRLYKISTTTEGHISGVEKVTKSDITELGIPSQDTTYDTATVNTDGLLSKEDKYILDNINNFIENYLDTLKVESTDHLGYVSEVSQEQGKVNVTYKEWPIFNQNTTGSSGSCIGNSATSTSTTFDSEGNNISQTYVKKYSVSMSTLGYEPNSEVSLDTFINDIYVKFGGNCIIDFEKNDNNAAFLIDKDNHKTELISGYTFYFGQCEKNVEDKYWLVGGGLLVSSSVGKQTYHLHAALANGINTTQSVCSISKILEDTDLISVYNGTRDKPITNEALSHALSTLKVNKTTGEGYVSAISQEGGVVQAHYTNWPIFNQNTTGSSGSCIGNSATSTQSDYPKGFKSYSNNATWGNPIGHTLAEWKTNNGGSVEWRVDNPESSKVSLKTTGRVYVNSDYATMGMTLKDNTWQMGTPDGKQEFIKTTEQGILPSDNNVSSLGNIEYAFASAYINNIHCNKLEGTASESLHSLSSDKLNEIELNVDLSNNNTSTFDGSKNTDISVKGILPVTNGGLGTTSLKDFIKNAAANLERENTVPTDNDYYISKSSGSIEYVRKSYKSLWEFIKLKISEDLGLTLQTYNGSTYAGIASKAISDNNGNEITTSYTRKYNISLHTMGFDINSNISVIDFVQKCKELFDNNSLISIVKDDNNAAYITDGKTTTELISGYTLYFSGNGGLLIGTSSNHRVYQFSCNEDSQFLGQLIQDIDFSSTYNPSSELPVNSKAIKNALSTLSLDKTTGDGYVSAISQNDGIVNAHYTNWPIFNQNTTGSSGSCTGNAATSTQSDYPKGFKSQTTNNDVDSITTWNTMSNGTVEWKDNTPSNGKASLSVNGRVFVGNENATMGMTLKNRYWGIGTPDGDDEAYIRTTKKGIIPFQEGSGISSNSTLGTSYYTFATAYIDNIYGHLKGSSDSCLGNAKTATKLETPIELSVDLSSNVPKYFDGSSNFETSVNGKLKISNGGTNADNEKDAVLNLFKGLDLNNIEPVDNSEFVSKTEGYYTRKSFSSLWNYIKTKMTNEGITKDTYQGLSIKAESDKYGNEINNSYTRKYTVSMTSMGYSPNTYIPVNVFLKECYNKFNSNAIIDFELDDTKAAYITDNENTTELVSGYTLILGMNNSTSGGGILIGTSDKNKVYHLLYNNDIQKVSIVLQDISLDSVYNSNGILPVNGKAIKDAISTISLEKTNGEGYVSAISQTNGKVNVTYTNWPIFNQNTTGSSASCTGNAATSTQSDYPKGFNKYDKGVIWGNLQGSSIAEWSEESGGKVDWRTLDGKLSMKVNGRLYVNDGNSAVPGMNFENKVWTLGTPDGDTTNVIATPSKGIVPNEYGVFHNGHSSIGAEDKYFSTAYIDNIYGHLKGSSESCDGNAKTATKLETPIEISVNLSSTEQTIFDGSNNTELPIKGVLSIENGGTGCTSSKDAFLNMYKALEEENDISTDNNFILSESIDKQQVVKKPYDSLYKYVLSKLNTDGFTPELYQGISNKAVSDKLGNDITSSYTRKYTTTLHKMGFDVNSNITAQQFLLKCYEVFGSDAVINISRQGEEAAYITDGKTTTELISGYTVFLGMNGTSGGALLFGSSDKLKAYHISTYNNESYVNTILHNLEVNDVYTENDPNPISSKGVKTALETLNVSTQPPSVENGYLCSIKQVNGKVDAIYQTWPIFNQNTTGSSASCTGNAATSTQSDYPKGFDGQNIDKWNNIKDDVVSNWTLEGNNAIGFTKKDNKVSLHSSGRVYVNSDYATMGMTLKDNTWQMGTPDGKQEFIKTTEQGILPSDNNSSSIGQADNKFKEAYISKIYGNVEGHLIGSSDSCDGNAKTATKLENPKKYYTTLNSSELVDIDFSTDNVGIPIQGVLNIENGGSGANNAEDGLSNLINNTSINNDEPKDEEYYVSQNNNKYKRKSYLSLWSYIKNKIYSVLGLSETLYKGTSSKAISDEEGLSFKENYIKTNGTTQMTSSLLLKESNSPSNVSIGNKNGNICIGNTTDYNSGTTIINNTLNVPNNSNLNTVEVNTLTVNNSSTLADTLINGILNSTQSIKVKDQEVPYDMKSLNNLIPHQNSYSPNNYSENSQGYLQLGNIVIKTGFVKGTDTGISSIEFDNTINFINAPIVICSNSLGVTPDNAEEYKNIASPLTSNITSLGFKLTCSKNISCSWIAIGSCAI